MLAYEATSEYAVLPQAFPLQKEAKLDRDNPTGCVVRHLRPISPHFESVEAADPANVCFWARKWGVTLMQIKIAAGRAGTRPENVFAEITGRQP